MTNRESTHGIPYRSVIDQVLKWGEPTLRPEEVTRVYVERRKGVTYEYPVDDPVRAESEYDLEGQVLPIRAQIVGFMLRENRTMPYKVRLETIEGNGTLVVEATGWQWWPDLTSAEGEE